MASVLSALCESFQPSEMTMSIQMLNDNFELNEKLKVRKDIKRRPF